MVVTLRRQQIRGLTIPAAMRNTLRRERLRRGLGLQELACQIGVHVEHLRRMENGSLKFKVKVETLQIWAGLFGYEIGLVMTKQG